MSEQILTVYGICPAVTLSIVVVSAQGGLTLLLNTPYKVWTLHLHGVSPHIISKIDMKSCVMKTVQEYLPCHCGQCLPPG